MRTSSLIVLGLSGTTLLTFSACNESDSAVGGAGGSGGRTGIAASAITTCVTFQRGVNGTVADAEMERSYGTWAEGSQPNLGTGKTGGGLGRSLLRFDLSSIPANATITSADVSIYVANAHATTVNVHRVTAPWTESSVTWNNFAAAYAPAVIATFPTNGWLTRTFSLTSQVQNWVSGVDANNGILLEEDASAYATGYDSSENGSVSLRPSLKVCYSTDATTSTGSSTASSTAASTAASTTSSTAASTSSSTASSSVSSSASSSVSSSASSSVSSSASSSSASSSSSTGSGGGGTTTLRIAVIGDWGALGGGETSVANMVKGWAPDVILTDGDNVYLGSGNTYDTNNGQFYHQFMFPYSGAYGAGSPTGTNRIFPIPGNHDWDASNLSQYLAFYGPMLGGTTGPTQRRYYHHFLDAAQRIHHFALDADDREPDGNSATSAQANWIHAAMSADTTSCFKIVSEHEPSHCSTIGQSEGPDATMDWPYASWGADIVLSGSRHGYERLSVDGIPYVVNGLGGGGLYGDWNIIDPHSVYRFPTTPQRYGAGLITITTGNGVGTMTIEFYGVSDGGAPDTVPSDSFTVTKACN